MIAAYWTIRRGLKGRLDCSMTKYTPGRRSLAARLAAYRSKMSGGFGKRSDFQWRPNIVEGW